MNELRQDLSTPESQEREVKRFINDTTDPLATVRRAQFTAFWAAPSAAHSWQVFAAIRRAWDELYSASVQLDAEPIYCECELAEGWR